jgi:hypothetical protein
MRLSGKKPVDSPLPTVNLLSPWVFEVMATRRLRQRFVLAACLLALVMGAGWGVQHLRATQARQILSIEKAESTRLAAQTSELAPVRVFVASVEQQKKTVTEAMRSEVRFSGILDELAMNTPADARVESVEVVLAPPAQETPAQEAAGEEQTEATPTPVPAPCPGPDPFNTRTVVGCITLSGSAASRSAVGQFVVNLGDTKIFVEPFISTTTTADGERVTFTGSVGLSEHVFTDRYTDLDELLETGESR